MGRRYTRNNNTNVTTNISTTFDIIRFIGILAEVVKILTKKIISTTNHNCILNKAQKFYLTNDKERFPNKEQFINENAIPYQEFIQLAINSMSNFPCRDDEKLALDLLDFNLHLFSDLMMTLPQHSTLCQYSEGF